MLKSRYFIAILLTMVCAGWFLIPWKSTPEDTPEDSPASSSKISSPKQRPVSVGVMVLKPSPYDRPIVVSGRTEALHKVSITAQMSGVLSKLNIQRGSDVEAGQVIATLANEGFRASVREAEANLQQKQIEFSNHQTLVAKGAQAELNGLKLETAIKGTEAALVRARVELEKTSILAPFSGTIHQVSALPGQSLQSGAPIAEIVALDPMQAIVEVTEHQRALIQNAHDVEVRFANGILSATGKVQFMAAKAEGRMHTYKVYVQIPNKEKHIVDGQICELFFKVNHDNVSKIPRSALVFRDDRGLGVHLVTEKAPQETEKVPQEPVTENVPQEQVVFMPVVMIDDSPEVVWIAGLLSMTNKIIVQGQDFVKEGQVVKSYDISTSLRN